MVIPLSWLAGRERVRKRRGRRATLRARAKGDSPRAETGRTASELASAPARALTATATGRASQLDAKGSSESRLRGPLLRRFTFTEVPFRRRRLKPPWTKTSLRTRVVTRVRAHVSACRCPRTPVLVMTDTATNCVTTQEGASSQAGRSADKPRNGQKRITSTNEEKHTRELYSEK